jgi:hypothetical protein
MMNKLRIIVAVTALLAGGVGHVLHRDAAVDEKAILMELAPGEAFSEKSGAPPHYRSTQGTVAFNSADAAPGIRGYAGPIRVLLVLGEDGKIRGIRIIEHRETKNYIHYMETPAYLGRFIGKSIFDPFEIDRDVDGISRATVSVEALAATVRESSRAVATSAYGFEVSPDVTKTPSGTKWIAYVLLFLLAAAGYVSSRRVRRFERLRDVCLIASVVIVGFYLSSPFSILHVFNILLLRIPSSVLWSVVVFSTLASAVLAGRFYCGWLCPFGALAELIGRIPVKKWSVPREQDDRWRNLKYLLLTMTLAAVLASGRVEYGNYEAYITLFAYHGNVFAWALVGSVLIANLRIKRFWCRYLCPVAALTGLLSRSDPAYVSRPDCPMDNVPNPKISECIRCNRCVQPGNVRST